ncbi:MAG: nuclear transport factor 2 family protein [Acidobacteria bacterium]|nr:MAG: nuclear transport factor 2 family protein [Acidobacteriota bacterium]REK03353.1 MAG: nuclear transport factor 2 family protein [Acidobacteriota bacterium]
MRQGGDDSLLFDLLDEDAVFLSPVVHTPQQGRQLTFAYLSAATKVFARSQFRYAGEWYAERSAVLEFEAEIDGIQINGVDMIWWNDEQRITRFKVMVRPLKAVNLLHQMMAGQLQNAAG